MLENLAIGLYALLTPMGITVIILGVIVGVILGAIPGISVTMAIVLLMPVSFTMQPLEGMMLLLGIYIGGMAGGFHSAILLGIPGSPASVATCFDGHPMAQKGQALKALGGAVLATFIGTISSVIVMIFASVSIARIALTFGPFEYFAIAIFSLSMISMLAGKSIVKGLSAGVLGMLFASSGMAPIDGAIRFNFGTVNMMASLDVLVVLVGVFALAEIMGSAETSRRVLKDDKIQIGPKSGVGFGISKQEFKEQIPNLARSSALGIGLGVLPGIGAATINLLAYSVAKARSKYSEKFGTGVLDGVMATESTNSATIGGSMVPLLTLGIPGDMATAMLLGGLMVHGLTPGPLLFIEETALVYGIFVSMAIASFVMLLVLLYGERFIVKVLKIPKHILLPIIFTMCIIGAFGLNNRIFDTYIVIIFGIVGYLFSKFKVPVGPFIMGFILGPMAETFFRRALMLSQGDYSPFLTRPISAMFLIGTALFLTAMTIKNIRARSNAKAKASA